MVTKASVAAKRLKTDEEQRLLNELNDAKSQLDDMAQRIGKFRGDIQLAMAARDAAIKERADTLAQFAELKERLVNLGAENNRLNGYIERVREEEAAADEPVKVGEETRIVLAPRRAPPVLYAGAAGGSMADAAMGVNSTSFHEANRAPRRRHWTSYGQ